MVSESIIHHLENLFKEHGSDCWWNFTTEELLPKELKHLAASLTKESDTIDVWFDSGCSPLLNSDCQGSFVCEGNDQYRGWFQSSLIVGVAVHGAAPYLEIASHGMILDDQGRKMSKSVGNVVDPMKIIELYGVEVLRGWVAMNNYENDVSLGPAQLQSAQDAVTKIRNCLRFMMGNIQDFKLQPLFACFAIDSYFLTIAEQCENLFRQFMSQRNLQKAFSLLLSFCSRDLSSFYFHISKDRLYADPLESPYRQSCVQTLHKILLMLIRCTYAILPFTATQVSDSMKISILEAIGSYQQRTAEYSLSGFFKSLRMLRDETLASVICALVQDKKLSETQQLCAYLKQSIPFEVTNREVSDLLQVSSIVRSNYSTPLYEDNKIALFRSQKHKCPRCWMWATTTEGTLCERCDPTEALFTGDLKV